MGHAVFTHWERAFPARNGREGRPARREGFPETDNPAAGAGFAYQGDKHVTYSV